MIYAIFVRNTPKSKWHFFSMTVSPETTTTEIEAAKQTAIKEGYDEAEVAIHTFDTMFYIPEYMNDVKGETALFN
jgi:hypothetical protein